MDIFIFYIVKAQYTWAKDLNRDLKDILTVKKHMKRCSTSLVIRDMKTKTTMRYQLIPTRMTTGEGNSHPLQHSCLENSMDRGAWPATVHGVAKSQLSN